jgi:FKBP-type peptidyl-prolyl cis-trans isomerase SlyD
MKKILISGLMLITAGMLSFYGCSKNSADYPADNSADNSVNNAANNAANKSGVGPGKKVTLDYTLSVDNSQVETSVGKTPLIYVVGSGKIIPGLEAQLIGMQMNEEKVITVAPNEAYGVINPEAFKEFPKTALPKGVEPKVGMLLLAATADGTKFATKISEIKGDKVVLDFNNPLAGKTLTFKVKILKIEKASAADAAAPQTK